MIGGSTKLTNALHIGYKAQGRYSAFDLEAYKLLDPLLPSAPVSLKLEKLSVTCVGKATGQTAWALQPGPKPRPLINRALGVQLARFLRAAYQVSVDARCFQGRQQFL